jgi:DNA repair ATPase RecN
VAEYTDVEITHQPSGNDRIQLKFTQNKGTELQDISDVTATTEYSCTEYEV